MKAWWLVMTFQYNLNNEALFAGLFWGLICLGVGGSALMAYDIRDMIK